MLALLLSLSAALCYGIGDFVGGTLSKRTSPWAIVVVAQSTGALAVLALALVMGGAPESADYLWAVGAGVCNGIGTAFLYRGLSSGRMGVVAPISGVGAAALPVLVGVLAGERPGTLVWLGILAALPGIWLVAREPGGSGGAPATGFVDGVLAGVGVGGLFACLGQIPDDAGFLPLALNQVVATLAVIVVATAVGVPWLPRDPAAALGTISGLLGAGATLSFLLATQTGFLTVAAVITSLYPAVTVVLAAAVLREAVHRGQAFGLIFCLAAVALVASG